MLNQRRIGRGIDGDRLLHQPVKQLPAMAGRAPVESELQSESRKLRVRLEGI
jgi:hypothetical protein